MGLKTKLAMAVVTSAAGAAMLAGGTFAYFNSQVSNNGNTFAAGTLTLTSTPTGGVGANGQMEISNAAPGQTFDQKWVLDNTGSLGFGDLTAAISYTSSIPSTNQKDSDTETNDFGTQLYVNHILIGTTDVTADVVSQLKLPAGTQLTLAELNGKTIDFGSLGQLQPNSSTTVEIQGDFNNSQAAQNYYQGASVTGGVTFTATQKTN